jgi:hypothetical protein
VYCLGSEALTNFAKYAHAPAATVSVAERGGALVVEVADETASAGPIRPLAPGSAASRTAWYRKIPPQGIFEQPNPYPEEHTHGPDRASA